MASYLESIARTIKTKCVNLSDAIVIVPSTRCIDEINANLLAEDLLLAPKYYSYTEFLIRFSDEHKNLHTSSRIEKSIILTQVLHDNGIDISMLPHYVSQIETNSNNSIEQIKDQYYKALNNANILHPDDASIDNIVNAAAGLQNQVFIVPTLDTDPRTNTPDNVTLFRLPAHRDISALKLLNQYAKNFALKNAYTGTQEITNPDIKIVECNSKIEQSHIIKTILSDYIIKDEKILIVNDDASFSKLCIHAIQESGAKHKEYKSITESHAYNLLQTLMQFDFSEQNFINLLTNPASQCYAPASQHSLIKRNSSSPKTDVAELLSLVDDINPNSSTALVKLQEIALSKSMSDAIKVLQDVFTSLVNFNACEPVVQFEMNEFFKELIYYTTYFNTPYSEAFNDTLHYIASQRSYEVRSGNDVEMLTLENLDYLDLNHKKIILCDSGVASLEKQALQNDDKESFGMLSYRLLNLIASNNVTLIRNNSAAQESSILHDSIVHDLKPTISHHYHQMLAQKYEAIPDAHLQQPTPQVPLELRSTEYSVSDIEQLMNDPYIFYLKKILKLREREKIWEIDYAKEFGNILHSIIASIDWLNLNNINDQAIAKLRIECDKLKIKSPILDAWEARVISAISFLKEYYTTNPINKYLSETEGKMELHIDEYVLSIKARADRIDIHSNGNVAIVDFKSGNTPTQKSVTEGKKPQLAVENLILASGGFSIPASESKAVYISLTNKDDDQKATNIKVDIDAVDESLHNLFRLFYSASAPYFATPLEPMPDYQHIKRLAEWL